MRELTTKKQSGIFMVLLFLFLFQDPLHVIFGPLKYTDEIFALLSIVFFFLKLVNNNYEYTFSRRVFICIGLIIVFVMSGFVGHFVNQYQPLSNALSDSLVVVKFFLAIVTAYFMFENCDFKDLAKKVWSFLNVITMILFLLAMIDFIFGIFGGGTRYGLRTVKLFYTTYTMLAAIAILLGAIYLRLYEFYKNRILPWILMLSFVILTTMRTKAIAAIIVMFFVYAIVCRKRKNIGLLVWGTISAIAILLGANQIIYYFGVLRNESARAMLTSTAFQIAKDYFPFGTGWGTYGSAFSVEPYSEVYHLYGLNKVWGLSTTYSSFVSDTFWPMILGESGVIGLILYVVILIILLKAIFELGKKNAYVFASGLFLIVYLLIASTSESAFVNSYAVAFAFWLGILFADNAQKRGVKHYE